MNDVLKMYRMSFLTTKHVSGIFDQKKLPGSKIEGFGEKSRIEMNRVKGRRPRDVENWSKRKLVEFSF